MEGRALNRKVSLNKAEKDNLIKNLVSAGIDEKTVNSILNPVASGCSGTCCHDPEKCTSLVEINPDAMGKLMTEIKKKGIDIKRLDPSVSKYLK